MISSEYRIDEILNELKNNYDIVGLKSEFAEECATLSETSKLKQLADKHAIELVLKIGGCEAKKDITDAKNIGINSLVAPMIESGYSFKKFIKNANEIYDNKRLYINIETITGYKNINEILDSECFDSLSGIIFGRSDFVHSLNLGCKNVNDNQIFEYVNLLSKKIQKTNKEFIIGGNISADSINFLQNISYISKFETRKVIFGSNLLNKKDIKKGIQLALEFEILWIKYKNNGILSESDKKRLRLLEMRNKL